MRREGPRSISSSSGNLLCRQARHRRRTRAAWLGARLPQVRAYLRPARSRGASGQAWAVGDTIHSALAVAASAARKQLLGISGQLKLKSKFRLWSYRHQLSPSPRPQPSSTRPSKPSSPSSESSCFGGTRRRNTQALVMLGKKWRRRPPTPLRQSVTSASTATPSRNGRKPIVANRRQPLQRALWPDSRCLGY